MREKLTTHFRKWGPKRFVIATVIVLIVTDLLNSWYLRLWWVAKEMSYKGVMMSAQHSGIAIEDLGPDSVREIQQFFDNSFYFLLLIILANNFFFYAFYLRRKLWAQGFVLFYALTAAAFSAMFFFDNAGLGTAWYLYNVLMVPVYLYIFLGVKYLKADTVDLPNH
jgi:hypothetical protein